MNDFSEIDESDPSLTDGYRVIYDREIPTLIKYQDKYQEMNEIPTLQVLNIRVIGNQNSIRIETFTENDLFFAFLHEVQEINYDQIRFNQKLQANFSDYARICITSLNKCLDETDYQQVKQRYKAIMTIKMDMTANLELVLETPVKNIPMIYFDFVSYDDEFIRKRIIYKYHQVRSSVLQQEERLQNILLRTK